MTQNDHDTYALEAAFLDAAAGPEVPLDLMARVLADGLEVQPIAVARVNTPSFWAQVVALLGGWQGLGGMATACCVGFWVGFNPPENLQDSFDTALYFQSMEVSDEDVALLGMGWDLEEG